APSRCPRAASRPGCRARTPGPTRRRPFPAAPPAAGPRAGAGRAPRSSELEADAEAQHVVLSRSGGIAHELVVALERRVPRRLVRQTEGGDPARERAVARHPRRDVRLRVVALVAEERVQLLG